MFANIDCLLNARFNDKLEETTLTQCPQHITSSPCRPSLIPSRAPASDGHQPMPLHWPATETGLHGALTITTESTTPTTETTTKSTGNTIIYSHV